MHRLLIPPSPLPTHILCPVAEWIWSSKLELRSAPGVGKPCGLACDIAWNLIRNCCAAQNTRKPQVSLKEHNSICSPGIDQKRCFFRGDITSHDVEGWKAAKFTPPVATRFSITMHHQWFLVVLRWFPDETWGWTLCKAERPSWRAKGLFQRYRTRRWWKYQRYLQERSVMHGWESESTDGPKGGWSCVS